MSDAAAVPAPPTARAADPRPRRVTERVRSERRLAWMLCGPAVFVMLAVTVYPIVYAIWLSLHRSDLRFPAASKFIGLANYGHVLSSSLWWADVGHTLIIAVFSVSIELVLGMGLALVMHRAIFGRGVVRAVALIPYGIVTVVAAFAWRYAWAADSGFVPKLLGLNYDPLTREFSSYVVIILTEVWKTTPFMALLLLAGLALVPDELHEAAKVDGATAWQRFVRITLPLIRPAILVALLFRTLDAVRVFDTVFIETAGQNKTETVSILGYNQLLNRLNLGLGSAVSVLVFAMVALLAFLFIKVLGTSLAQQRGEK
ncbi:MAG: trehalose/maltose transport system permease protein [Solirubrobacteraceae bacterium]|jgi:multiple sugar transport system permease protein|nr:trehalose/maltose transport system permease protein [Solirubrobacteraceae bacterium]